ncbi:alpha/beta hydrolase [Tuwongella immobilis]|nr:alpha/beta hydrolase [Tuwongella immobilis]
MNLRRLVLGIIGVGLFAPTMLRAEEPIPLWPKDVPNETKPVGPEKIDPLKNPRIGSIQLLTNVDRPTLKLFRPEKPNGTAVIIAPGGGYRILAWDLEGEEVAKWLNSIGVTAFVLKYRVPRRPDEPEGTLPLRPLQDAQRAIRVVRSKAAAFGLKENRIGILGFSAGGNLAARAATNFEQSSYPAIDALDEQSARPDFAVLIYPAYLLNPEKTAVRKELPISAKTPPMFFAHAMDDPIESEGSVMLHLALRKAKVGSELHVYSTGGHGFGLRSTDSQSMHWPKQCTDWMRAAGWLPEVVK